MLVGWGIDSLNSSAFLLAIIAILFGGCLALCFFSLFSTEAKKISEGEKEYQLRLKKYNIDLKEYYDKLQDDKDRLEKELVQKSVLTANLNKLLNQRTQSSSNLLQYIAKLLFSQKTGSSLCFVPFMNTFVLVAAQLWKGAMALIISLKWKCDLIELLQVSTLSLLIYNP